MRVAVVGGGVVGLFTAWYLERDGAEVTVFEPGPLGAGSIHAAGILEPSTAYPTNTFAFLRRVARFVRSGTCTFRSVDAPWLVESLRQLERPPPDDAGPTLRSLGTDSMAAYRALAATRNDFGFAPTGLVEVYRDARHFEEERAKALARRSEVPVEVREHAGAAGALFYPEVAALDTSPLVERLRREMPRSSIVHQRVERLDLDGGVTVAGHRAPFDAVVASLGVGCRRLGVPLTGVRGYGWRARLRTPIPTATIFVDEGIAAVPLGDVAKLTGGWDFDLSGRPNHATTVQRAVQRVLDVAAFLDFRDGARPTTPDGLPTIGRSGALVVATGGFRLGWSHGPAMGRWAADLALGRRRNDPFLARYCGALRGSAL